MLARLRDAVFGRPVAGIAPTVVQLALILLWHPLLFILCDAIYIRLARPVEDFWRRAGVRAEAVRAGDWAANAWPPLSEYAELARVASGMTALTGLMGTLAFVLFRSLRRERQAEPSVASFIRLWWRTCLWGTLLVPAVLVAAYVLPQWEWVESAAWLACAAYLLLGPALLAREELRSRSLRLARWRPECPECGYSLRRPSADRCSECGEAFLTNGRVFRRWAVRRIAWDRRDRGSLLLAYVRTVALIICRPRRAACELCIPDRFDRASRWAGAHLLAFAALGLLFGGQLMFAKWAASMFVPPDSVYIANAEDFLQPGALRMALWAGQSFAAWLVAGGVILLAGFLVTLLAGGRRAAAQAGVFKWTLYLATILPLASLSWYAPQVAREAGPALWNAVRAGPPAPAEVAVRLRPPHRAPAVFLALPFAVWWGLGVSANPYLPRRGWRSALLHVYLFMAAWLLLVVLFAPGALRALL